MKETPRYTAHVENDAQKLVRNFTSETFNSVASSAPAMAVGKSDRPTWRQFAKFYRPWSHMRVLIGCCLTWFCLDVAFYGLNLNQSHVLDAMGYVTHYNTSNSSLAPPPSALFDSLFEIAIGNVVIAAAGTVPGYWLTVAFIDTRMGRWWIQMVGFLVAA
jgi:PHS family inorganic phosphate transporter-like MFS transporter